MNNEFNIEFVYRGGMSVSFDEAESPYLYNHVLTRAEDGTPIYIKFGVAHLVVDVFATNDYLSYESSPYEGAWDFEGEQAFDSEIDPVGHVHWQAKLDAHHTEWQTRMDSISAEWDEPQGESVLAKLRGVKIAGLDDEE